MTNTGKETVLLFLRGVPRRGEEINPVHITIPLPAAQYSPLPRGRVANR